MAIAMFLRERLHLALRPELTRPFPVGKGVDFVGWNTWWNRRLPRRRTLGTLRTRLAHFERAAVRPMWGGRARRIDLRRQDAAGSVARLQAVLASYAGHLWHGAAWRAWEALWQQYPWLSALFRRQGWALAVRWSPRRLARVRRFQAQYWHLVHHAGDNTLVFFPCGRYIEFYGPQRVVAAAALGLRPIRLPRASYALTVGFPVWLSGAYLSSAIRQGLWVIEVQPRQTFLRHGCPPAPATCRVAPGRPGWRCVVGSPWRARVPGLRWQHAVADALEKRYTENNAIQTALRPQAVRDEMAAIGRNSRTFWRYRCSNCARNWRRSAPNWRPCRMPAHRSHDLPGAWRPAAPQGRAARGRRAGGWGEAAAARGGKGALELLSAMSRLPGLQPGEAAALQVGEDLTGHAGTDILLPGHGCLPG